ncbi:uncharacterized protein LOC144627562 isoform X2 [Crassostrea virginica]
MASDKDRTRFFKLSLVIIDELTQILRDLLLTNVSPTQIYKKVKRSTFRNTLRPHQISVIKKAQNDGYRKFDISLLYILLRNVCPNITPPSQGWGVSTMPSPNEVTVGDDIERIRLIRNNLFGHISEAAIKETIFKDNLSTISGICTRMQTLLSKDYVKRLQEAEESSIDADTENKYIDLIKRLVDEEKDIIDKITELTSEEIITIQAREAEKTTIVETLIATSISILNEMVAAVHELTSEADIGHIYESINDYILGNREPENKPLEDLFKKLEEKNKVYAKIQKTDQMKILANFNKFILKMRKEYGAGVGFSKNSILLLVTCSSKSGYNHYKNDLEEGKIGMLIMELFLFPPFRGSFELKEDEIEIRLNDRLLTQCKELTSEEIITIQAREAERTTIVETLIATSISVLNEMVAAVHKLTSEADIGRMYESINDYIRENREPENKPLENLFKKLEKKIKVYAKIQKTNQMKILANFNKFILKMHKEYGASVGFSKSSILLHVTCSSKSGYNHYKNDLEQGQIGMQIMELFLFPPFLGSFELKEDEIEIRLNGKLLTQRKGSKTSIFHDMESTRISTQVSVKHCSLCQGDIEYYCKGCQQDLCIQCKKLHAKDLSTKHHTVTSYAEKMKYQPKQVKSSQSGNPKQVISARSQDAKQMISVQYQNSEQMTSMTSILHDMESTRISTQVSVKHCSLCQGDTEYYCYKCQQDLCIQCKKLHVIDLGTKHHKVTSYAEKMKYPRKQVKSSLSKDPKRVISVQYQNSKQTKRWRSGDPKQSISARSQDPNNHEPCVIPSAKRSHHEVRDPVWFSSLERNEIQRQQYSDRIYHLRGETIYDRSVLLEGLRHDRETGHKAVTIRGQSKAELRGQGLKDLIDEVLAGDLEDRCIIQKTIMTRHMTKLLRYYHRFEKLSKTMETRPFKFLRIMTQKHSTQKDDMKPIINILVNLMKEIRLVPSGIPRRAGVEDLLTLLSCPVLQKSLSVTGVERCSHISCVTPDRVWVSDYGNLILIDTATVDEKLHSVEDSLNSLTGMHTVNCMGELIYIDKEYNINKLCNDMNTTTKLIKYTDTTWKPRCVYCSPSSGDLLVGMRTAKYPRTGKVMRYDNTGKHKQTIPHDDNTPHTLYRSPCYITENNNGDVLVSDFDRHAVVVTSVEGILRFSYTGPPPSGSGLKPLGICTDVMSHILVIDYRTATVQMLDRDGQFLSYVLTRQTPGMDYKPRDLSYDVTTHSVRVGSLNNNTMSVCRYINRHLRLSDETEHHDNLDEDKPKTGQR